MTFKNPRGITGIQPRPLNSPWGRVDQGTILADGIVQVETAGHGGIYVTQERWEAMPEDIRSLNTYGGGRWYEEDCEWSLVVLSFPEEFPADWYEGAVRTALVYYPSALPKEKGAGE